MIGYNPTGGTMGKRSHPWIDARSLRMAQAIAEKLRADPSLLEIARGNLRRWKSRLSPWPKSLQEWEGILDRGSLPEVLEILLDPGDAGCRRRQSSPFTGILTVRERKAIFEDHEKIGA
jgi:hypothetical protein